MPSGTSRTVVTDAEGRYTAQGLRVGGPFDVKASGDNGANAEQDDVYLQARRRNDAEPHRHAPSNATELAGVTVTAAAPGATFQADNKGLSSNVSQRELKVIPNPNRSIQDIARTDPHIMLTNVGRGEISALGQNSRYNNITIDGVPTNDSFGLEANGLPALNQPLSFDAIEEYNISTMNFDVTNKRSVGANVNIVTKSGTNDFHGDVYYAYTNANDLTGDESERLQRLRRQENLRRDDRRTDHQGHAVLLPGLRRIEDARAGPGIRSDRLGRVEHRQHQPGRHQPHHQHRRQGYGLTPGTLGASDANQDNKLYLAKLDWNISDGHRASFRYNETKSDQPIIQTFNATTLSLSSYSYVQQRDLKSYVLNLYDDWTDTFSTEGSFSYSKVRCGFAHARRSAADPGLHRSVGLLRRRTRRYFSARTSSVTTTCSA